MNQFLIEELYLLGPNNYTKYMYLNGVIPYSRSHGYGHYKARKSYPPAFSMRLKDYSDDLERIRAKRLLNKNEG